MTDHIADVSKMVGERKLPIENCPYSDGNACEQYRLQGKRCQDCPLLSCNAGRHAALLERARDPEQKVEGCAILLFRADKTYASWWSAQVRTVEKVGYLESMKLQLLLGSNDESAEGAKK